MNTQHDLIQGTPEWMAHRLQHFGASEAAAMLGISKRTTRNELLRAKATGLPREFSDWVQANLLDAGHVAEALARPLAEELVGEDLFPVTVSQGRLSASTDGLNMTGAIAWESKMWNEASAALVREGMVPEEHIPQCQQVLMVTEAEKLLFSVTDGTRERFVYVWVYPDKAWFERIRAGWAQFEVDLALWVPPPAAAPAPIGKAPEALPALLIEVSGEVTASNLVEFRATALTAIRSVNRDLQTDEDFANAEKAVKWCGDVEERLAAAKQHALSQTSSIETLFRTMDEINAEARQVRLDLEKLVKARKEGKRTEIVMGGQTALDEHVAALNKRMGAVWIPRQQGAFAEAIKGKKNFSSMQDSVDAALANAKIAASALADRLEANRKALTVDGVDYFFLFADFANVGSKAPEDFTAIATLRIQNEQARLAKIAADAKAKQDAIDQAAAAAQKPADPIGEALGGLPVIGTLQSSGPRGSGQFSFGPAATPSRVPSASTLSQTRAAAAPPISTGVLNQRLGQGITLTVEGVKALGVQPVAVPGQRATVFWAEADYPRILAALIGHLEGLYEKAVQQ